MGNERKRRPRVNPLDSPRRRPSFWEETRSTLVTALFIVGSVLNLLALLLLLGNAVRLWRALTTGELPALGPDLLLPFGAFLAGLLCYLVARWLDA